MVDIYDEKVSFLPESYFRSKTYPLFEKLKKKLLLNIPGADIQHVGSTAIPGSLTKGDLDIQVRVAESQYDSAKQCLSKLFEINTGGFAAVDAVSFEDYSSDSSVGVHLTIIDGSCDMQYRFRDILCDHELLRLEYDDLKRSFEGKSMTRYREAKADFVEKVLKNNNE